VIYDNFGLADTSASSIGWTIGVGHVQGDSFTPAGNFSVDAITVAISVFAGVDQADFFLMTDVLDHPGSVLEAFHVTNLRPFGGAIPPSSAGSLLHPLLLGGTQYWLIASATDPTAHLAWNINTNMDVGPHAESSTTAGPWMIQPAGRGTFRIIGTPSTEFAEPSSPAVMGIALIALLLRRGRSVRLRRVTLRQSQADLGSPNRNASERSSRT
jgi:hypothetical protein